MSFRVRVLALVMLVAVSATAATAWLTLQQAERQITAAESLDKAQIEEITNRIEEYGARHGTWEGVATLVADLGARLEQRIHLVTESGTVLVDTDTLAGRTARPLGSVTSFVDPRPVLSLSAIRPDKTSVVANLVVGYRIGVRFAACLTRSGTEPTTSTGAYGVPVFEAASGDARAPDDVVAACHEAAAEPDRDAGDDPARLASCRDPDVAGPLGACLARVFEVLTSDVAPVPLRIYLGARDDRLTRLALGPLVAAAAGVAAVAIAGTALLSRRVLRPIGRVTAAARRLGEGDLTDRVPAAGNDELAELARSFNRMADSLQWAEERQRRLVADVAHELRTPLVNLRGYLEALKDGVIAPDSEVFASLHEEAVLQQRIVDDLQDLALAEAGRLAYHRTEVDLAELLETCRTAHHALADAAGVALTVTADRVVVTGDPDRLRQVVGNLISNALRATAAGGSIALSAGLDDGSAMVRVRDTGSGIPADALPFVFNRFWRADSARGRRTGGSGLGLAIARQIVRDHGGSIAVASQTGVGTTFTITLPAAS